MSPHHLAIMTKPDAFSQKWGSMLPYADPPWCLIGQVLAKALCEGATLVLITPCWPTAAGLGSLLCKIGLKVTDYRQKCYLP